MKVEKISVNSLKPLQVNVRRHNDKQIDELIRSVKQFGQTRAIVIDESNNILVGNGLYLALKKMGEQHAFCIKKTGLSDGEKKKLILADNRIYSLGTDDYDGITQFIKDISLTGDYDVPGYDMEVLKNISMTDIQVANIAMDYGTVTNQNEQQDDINYNDNACNAEQYSHEDAQEIELTKSQKCIMCPNCGEMIYID